MTTAPSSTQAPVPVTVENFVRAESDRFFGGIVQRGGFGKWDHVREPAPLDQQTVIRLNRDTLYTSAIFDLDAAPVTITLPNAGQRFMSMQVISEDHYTIATIYEPGRYTLTRDEVGTRYVCVAIRTLVDPNNPADLDQVHALQDAIEIEQASSGRFEVPHWDPVSQSKVRDALLVLASTLQDTKQMFGTKEQVDPIRYLVGSAMAWGGNRETEAMYLNLTPPQNDGKVVYTLNVKDVPVNSFWSISVYNAEGYFQPNDFDSYSLNNITAKPNPDGSITVQFGGCDGQTPNCLPIFPNWNYMVRLYRPRPEILDGSWTFPSLSASTT